MRALMTLKKMKELVLKEFSSSFHDDAPPEHKIRKCPGRPNRHFYVYWIDGQIEHRETYFVYSGHPIGTALLAYSEKRYAPWERWIEER